MCVVNFIIYIYIYIYYPWFGTYIRSDLSVSNPLQSIQYVEFECREDDDDSDILVRSIGNVTLVEQSLYDFQLETSIMFWRRLSFSVVLDRALH